MGRAPGSKTGGCGFESLHSCQRRKFETLGVPLGCADYYRGSVVVMANANPAQFMREVRQEVSKVTWPTRKETVVTTAMVFVMSVVAALFFFFTDKIIAWVIQLILGIGG